MKCQEVMILLPEYFRGKTSEKETADISAHIHTCSSCQVESIQVQAMVDSINKEKSWEPDSFYWINIIPNIHNRLERKQNRSTYEKILRFIMPVAATMSIFIIVLTVMNNPDSENQYTGRFNLNSIPLSELSEYYAIQTALEGFNPLSIDGFDNEQSADSEILAEIIVQDSKSIASSYFGDKDILDLISKDNDAAIVAALQK
ncbi:MAG: zf-HC2 domain-containing protein [Ignavibacteriales bacterium]|nr:zf-HC2 domain-containing protein [Ignavibacteriales bacterium]